MFSKNIKWDWPNQRTVFCYHVCNCILLIYTRLLEEVMLYRCWRGKFEENIHVGFHIFNLGLNLACEKEISVFNSYVYKHIKYSKLSLKKPSVFVFRIIVSHHLPHFVDVSPVLVVLQPFPKHRHDLIAGHRIVCKVRDVSHLRAGWTPWIIGCSFPNLQKKQKK